MLAEVNTKWQPIVTAPRNGTPCKVSIQRRGIIDAVFYARYEVVLHPVGLNPCAAWVALDNSIVLYDGGPNTPTHWAPLTRH